MTFYGSCGHTTVEEIDDSTWERFATIPGHGPLGQEAEPNFSVTCPEDDVQMVYVYPLRFFLCQKCGAEEIEAMEKEYFEDAYRRLRELHEKPLRFSHNYGTLELRLEREGAVLDLGRKLLPGYSDDRILDIACSKAPNVELTQG